MILPVAAQDTVLFVDDDENILKSIQRGLSDEPYAVKLATSGREALEIMARELIAVVVTDMRMPEMDGLELLKVAMEKHPDVVRIILTGYTQVYTLIPVINSGGVFRYLTKPWKMETDFIPTIRQAILHYHMTMERQELGEKLQQQNQTLVEQNRRIDDYLRIISQDDEFKTKLLSGLIEEMTPFLEKLRIALEELQEGQVQTLLNGAVDLYAQMISIQANLQTIVSYLVKPNTGE